MAARQRRPPGGSAHKPHRPPRLGPEPSDQHQALTERIIQDRERALVQALSPAPDPIRPVSPIQALQETVQESLELFDSLQDGIAFNPPMACKRGCVHCCANQVGLGEPEALGLGLHLLETRGPEALAELAARGRALVADLHGKSWRDVGMERHLRACLFLGETGCTVYPARPLACRGWNAVDAAQCLRSNESADAMTLVEQHPLPMLLAEAVRTGMLRGAQALGLETGFLLLPRAVVLMLDTGVMACAEAWLAGRAFFAANRER